MQPKLCVKCKKTAALWLLSWIFLVPNLEWGMDRGPVLTTTAVAGGQWEYQAPIVLSYGCMASATPLEVTLWVAGVMIAVCFFLGEIMVVCSLWARKGMHKSRKCPVPFSPGAYRCGFPNR